MNGAAGSNDARQPATTPNAQCSMPNALSGTGTGSGWGSKVPGDPGYST